MDPLDQRSARAVNAMMGARMRYDVVVFDFDGTLMDTREAIVASVQYALAAGGLPVPEEAAIWRRVGTGLHQVLGGLSGFAPEGPEVARLAEAYLARFDEEAPGRTRLIEGVGEALARLQAAGARLAIATNRGRPSLMRILEEHGLAAAFPCIVTSTCVARPKPAPDMLERILGHFGAAAERALMIGDTVVDVRLGQAAGVDTCAVTYGAQEAAELAAERPTHLVHHARELPSLVME